MYSQAPKIITLPAVQFLLWKLSIFSGRMVVNSYTRVHTSQLKCVLWPDINWSHPHSQHSWQYLWFVKTVFAPWFFTNPMTVVAIHNWLLPTQMMDGRVSLNFKSTHDSSTEPRAVVAKLGLLLSLCQSQNNDCPGHISDDCTLTRHSIHFKRNTSTGAVYWTYWTGLRKCTVPKSLNGPTDT